MHKFTLTLLAASLALPGIGSHADPLYTITDLSNGTGQPVLANGINASGDIVGSGYGGRYGNERALLYHNATPSFLISDYQDYSQAYAINDSGQIVGNSIADSFSFPAFRYSNGTMTILGGPSSLSFAPYAFGINNVGQILLRGVDDRILDVAILLNTDGMMQTVGLSGMGNRNIAMGINDSGDVVGSTINQ